MRTIELSAVLSLRDKLSAQMNKASKSVSAMTDKVNESRDAISKISATQNINISARSNISEMVASAKTSIISLQNTISQKELSLQTKIDFDGFEVETINSKLSEFGNFLNKNSGKVEEYGNKLAVLKQRQAKFTDKTKGSMKLGVEQSIESLQKKLADIEAAKQQLVEWEKIRLDYNDLELAKAELSTLEKAVDHLNRTNVAVKAYIDFKTDALKQVYDIDEKLKSIGKRVINPVIKLKDQATVKINGIKEKAKNLAHEKFAPVISAVDKAKSTLSSVKTGLAKIAGTVAYPIIKVKDTASPVVRKIASGIKKVAGKVWSATVKIIDKTGSALKKIGSGINKVMGLAAKGIAIGATATIGGAVAATSSVTSKQRAVNSMVAQTGNNSAEQKTELSGIMSNLYQDNMGESYEDIGNSLSKVSQITNATGKDLEGLTHNAILMRDTFGYDVTESVRSAKMMMDQFGISGDEAYNLIAEGTQNGLNKNDDLLDTLNEYGVHFKQMGFSSTEMMNMLSNGAKNGTFSVDKLGDSIKEFGIRTKDGSDGTKQAFKDIGLDATKLTNDFAVGGDRGKAAFQQVTAALAGMKDPVKQNAAGVALFGTMWEDLGTDGVLAMSQLNGSIEGGTAALQKINEVKYDDLGSAFSGLKRTFTDAVLNPIGEALLPTVTKGVNTLRGFATQLGDAIKSGDMSAIGGVFEDFIAAGVQSIQKGTPKIIAVLFKGLGGLQGSIKELLPGLLQNGVDVITQIAQGIVEGMPLVADVVVGIITTLSDSMSQNLEPILSAALNVLMALVDGITKSIPVLIPAVVQIITGLVTFLSENLGTILMAALAILMALVQGIIDSIPVLIPAVIEVVMNLVQFLSENLPMILDAALNIILAIVQGLTENIPMLVDGVIQIITGLVTFITENLPMIVEGALQIIVALVQGLIEALPQLADGALQLVQAIWDTIINTDWLQLGIDLIRGIGDGLVSGLKQIGSTIENVAGSIVSKFKSFLGIHSPSRVMKAEVGFNMGAGVAEGLKDTKAMVNNEIESLASDMTITMRTNMPPVKPYEISEPEKPKQPKNFQEPKTSQDGSDGYKGLDIAQPIDRDNSSNSYHATTNNSSAKEKKIYIEKLIENVTITGEADEDRLIKKVLTYLADDIEETAENMGEEEID